MALETPGLTGLALADFAGDALPDLVFARDAAPPALVRNLGNGHHWLALQLGGHWRVNPQLMRTNSHGIGTRVVAEGKGIRVVCDYTTTDAGLAQSIGPVVLGLGKNAEVDLLHVSWPDGVIQCELTVTANEKRTLAENNRKTASCPVLFTWNGDRFVCLGDFPGGGGLGYLVAPGIYSQPDRDEAVAISAEQLRAEQGIFPYLLAGTAATYFAPPVTAKTPTPSPRPATRSSPCPGGPCPPFRCPPDAPGPPARLTNLIDASFRPVRSVAGRRHCRLPAAARDC